MRTADYSITIFERSLRGKVEERLNQLAEQICTGSSIIEYASFRHLTGRIASLREVLDMMVTVNEDIHRQPKD